MHLKTPHFDGLLKTMFLSRSFSSNQFNPIRKALNTCGLFVLSGSYPDNVLNYNTPESYLRAERFAKDKVFPFPVTAIEDADSCCICWPLDGQKEWCGFLSYMVESASLGALQTIRESLKKKGIQEPPERFCEGVSSWFYAPRLPVHALSTKMLETGEASFYFPPSVVGPDLTYYSVRLIHGEKDPNFPQPGPNENHYFPFLFEVAYIMSPSTYIVRQTPAIPPQGFSTPRGSNYTGDKRALHTVMELPGLHTLFEKKDPSEARQKLTIGHHRRAHYRTLRSEFWAHKRGAVVPVKQTWCGPTTIAIDGKTYSILPKEAL